MPLPLSTVRYLRTRVKERGQGYVFTKEKYIRPFLPKLRRMFQIFDDDGSGEIDLLELEAALYDYNEIPKKEIVRLLSVFRELDGVKDDGQISFDEFVSVMKTSKSFADPRSFYFLNDEQGTEDQEINEKFAAFANLYERKKNQRKVDVDTRDFKSYKNFHLLFSGTYNLPSANLLAGENTDLPNIEDDDEIEEKVRREKRNQRRRRRRKKRRQRETEMIDIFDDIDPQTNFRGGQVYRKQTSFAKHDITLKSKANKLAGVLLRENSMKLPMIPKQFVSPLQKNKKTSMLKGSKSIYHPSYVSSAASSMYSDSLNGSYASGPGSRQFSRHSTKYNNTSTRGSNKMMMKFKMNASTNLHRRTRAVIGRKIDLPKPPFPISTW
eukprot:g1420.t1